MAAGSAQSSKSRARRKRRHLRRPRDQVQTVRLYPVVPAEQVGDHTGRGEAQSARAAAACPLKGAKTRFRWREVAALQERASFGTPHDRPVTRRERFRPVAGARLARGGFARPVWLLRARHPDDAAADGEAKRRLLPARGLLLRLRLRLRLARLAWRRILLRPLR
jgi:hypothetical protein